MKKVIFMMLVSLVFTTGFTCSKNTPPADPAAVPQQNSQEEMAAPNPATEEPAPNTTPPPAQEPSPVTN